MSFIHKIIDRATRHNNATEEKPQRLSFFGFGGSTSTSASSIDQQIDEPDAVEPELKKTPSTTTNSSLKTGKHIYIYMCIE